MKCAITSCCEMPVRPGLQESTRSRCIEAVDRCYDMFGALFDSLVHSIQSADPGTVQHMRDRARQLRMAAGCIAMASAP